MIDPYEAAWVFIIALAGGMLLSCCYGSWGPVQ